VIGNNSIRAGFDRTCIEQALNARSAPGVSEVVLNPDAHAGYGVPVGCVMASPTHIYPGPVGVDIKCSMSLLQLDLPADAVQDKQVRRDLITAICERTPTGAGKGQRQAKKSRKVHAEIGKIVAVEGASKQVCELLGIPRAWRHRCEDHHHVGHDGTADALKVRLDHLIDSGRFPAFANKVTQLGSYGGGNHFGECEVVHVEPGQEATADAFGLKDGPPSCPTAAPAASATTLRKASSTPCKPSSTPGARLTPAATKSCATRLWAPKKPTTTSTTWRWAPTSPP